MMLFDNLFLNILFIVFVLIIIIILVLYFIFDDSLLILWFIFNKKNMRYKMLRKLIKEDQEIYILGSLHHMHYDLKDFSFLHLKAVLENLKPDLLLIESRQVELDSGNLADGPIEMFYLHMLAKEMNIPVKGVDWFSHHESKPGTTNKKRDLMITNNIEKGIGNYKKVLVVIGATHMLVDTKLLKRRGFKVSRLKKPEKDFLYTHKDEELVFPKETRKYIKYRIEREREFSNTEVLNDQWKQAMNRMINNLENFVIKIDNKEVIIDEA